MFPRLEWQKNYLHLALLSVLGLLRSKPREIQVHVLQELTLDQFLSASFFGVKSYYHNVSLLVFFHCLSFTKSLPISSELKKSTK